MVGRIAEDYAACADGRTRQMGSRPSTADTVQRAALSSLLLQVMLLSFKIPRFDTY